MDKKDFFEKLMDDKIERDSSEEEAELAVAEEKEEKPKKIKIVKNEGDKKPKKMPEGQLTIDMYQTPGEIVIRTAVAGVSEKDLDISITNDLVEIRGRRESEEEVEEEGYYYRECFWGSFSRSLILPVEVEADKSTASLKNNVLTIRLPKSEKTKTKKISIKPA